jgi:hypothetical protein
MHFRNLRNKYQKLPKRDFEIMFGARKSMERCSWPRQGRSALLNLAVDILKERAMRRKSTAWSKVCTGLGNSKIMRTDNVPSMFAGLDIVPKKGIPGYVGACACWTLLRRRLEKRYAISDFNSTVLSLWCTVIELLLKVQAFLSGFNKHDSLAVVVLRGSHAGASFAKSTSTAPPHSFSSTFPSPLSNLGVRRCLEFYNSDCSRQDLNSPRCLDQR